MGNELKNWISYIDTEMGCFDLKTPTFAIEPEPRLKNHRAHGQYY